MQRECDCKADIIDYLFKMLHELGHRAYMYIVRAMTLTSEPSEVKRDGFVGLAFRAHFVLILFRDVVHLEHRAQASKGHMNC